MEIASARHLLSEWHRTSQRFRYRRRPTACRSLSTILVHARYALNVRWLPKAYSRVSWWIYVKPVINHEGRPQTDSRFVQFRRTSIPANARLVSLSGGAEDRHEPVSSGLHHRYRATRIGQDRRQSAGDNRNDGPDILDLTSIDAGKSGVTAHGNYSSPIDGLDFCQ